MVTITKEKEKYHGVPDKTRNCDYLILDEMISWVFTIEKSEFYKHTWMDETWEW